MGLWVVAGSWSSDQLTDGHIPHHMLAALGFTARDASALVTAGLWRTDSDGWHFHDWQAMNPSRADVEAKRGAEAEKKRRWREKVRRDTETGQFQTPKLRAIGDEE